jgi:RimJ/RimL family protein N-acetyltransferase
LEAGDARALSNYRSLPEVARFQSWISFKLDDATRLIEEQDGLEPGIPGTWFQMALVEKAANRIVGDCGLHCLRDDPRQMELGITVAPNYQKCGYGTEALTCVLDFLFGTLGMHRVCAVTAAQNLAAASLFRRLGFRQEAHFIEHRWHKENWESELLFAILQREWTSETKRKSQAQNPSPKAFAQ